MKKQILLLCLALTSLCSYAQTITVKGVVTSASASISISTFTPISTSTLMVNN